MNPIFVTYGTPNAFYVFRMIHVGIAIGLKLVHSLIAGDLRVIGRIGLMPGAQDGDHVYAALSKAVIVAGVEIQQSSGYVAFGLIGGLKNGFAPVISSTIALPGSIVVINRRGRDACHCVEGQIAPGGVYLHSGNKEVMQICLFTAAFAAGKPALGVGVFGIGVRLPVVAGIDRINLPGVNAFHRAIYIIQFLEEVVLGAVVAGIGVGVDQVA